MERTQTNPVKLVGENLKRVIRTSPYRTQAKFAEAFSSDERTVGRWCNDGIDKISLVFQIADFLDIDVSALLPL